MALRERAGSDAAPNALDSARRVGLEVLVRSLQGSNHGRYAARL